MFSSCLSSRLLKIHIDFNKLLTKKKLKGYTNVYNKAGKLISKHSSKLPGGCKESRVGL